MNVAQYTYTDDYNGVGGEERVREYHENKQKRRVAG